MQTKLGPGAAPRPEDPSPAKTDVCIARKTSEGSPTTLGIDTDSSGASPTRLGIDTASSEASPSRSASARTVRTCRRRGSASTWQARMSRRRCPHRPGPFGRVAVDARHRHVKVGGVAVDARVDLAQDAMLAIVRCVSTFADARKVGLSTYAYTIGGRSRSRLGSGRGRFERVRSSELLDLPRRLGRGRRRQVLRGAGAERREVPLAQVDPCLHPARQRTSGFRALLHGLPEALFSLLWAHSPAPSPCRNASPALGPQRSPEPCSCSGAAAP